MRITRSSLVAGAFCVAAARMAAQAPAAELRVIAPSVVYNAWLLDLAASFEEETRTKVTVTSIGMGAS
jgi:ABC-type tungstate transport system permease subunit